VNLAKVLLIAGLVFSAVSAAEILQFFGIRALGETFDPLTIVLDATETLLAVSFEQ